MGQAITALAEDDDADELFLQQQQRLHLRWLQQQIQEARTAPVVEQPGVHRAKVIDNFVHLQAKTLAFIAGGDADAVNLKPRFTFTFDASVGGKAVLYRRAEVLLDETGGWQLQGAKWISEAKAFEAGLGQELEMALASNVLSPSNAGADAGAGGSSSDSMETFLKEEENWCGEHGDGFDPALQRCPWLIELRAQTDSLNVEWTACQVAKICTAPGRGLKERLAKFARSANKSKELDLVVISQQCICNDGPVRELMEVYGSEIGPQGTRSDCIVCQSNARDTMLLPCRHLCLCGDCAEYIRTRSQTNSYKCPVCRKRISRIMPLGD